MRRIRRIARGGAVVSAVLLGLALASVSLVLLVPGVVLNEPVLRKAAAWVEGREAGPGIGWRRIGIDWEVTGFLGRRVRIAFEGLRIDMPGVGGTWQPAGSIAFAYDLRRIVPRLREFGPVHLAGGRTSVRMASGEAAAAPRAQGGSGAPPARVRDIVLRDVDIADQAWTVALGDAVVGGVLSVRAREGGDGGVRIEVDGAYRLTGGKAAHSATVRLSVVGPGRPWSLQWSRPWEAEGDARWDAEARVAFEGEDLGEGRLHLAAGTRGDAVDWRVVGRWAHDAGDAELDAGGRWEADRVTGQVDAAASPARPIGPVGRPRLRAAACGFAWQADGAAQSIDVECPLRLDAGADADDGFRADGHPLVALQLALEARAPRPLDRAAPLEARVEIVPQALWLARASGSVRARGTVVPGAGPRQLEEVRTEVDLGLELPRFQELVATLAGSDWAIPAPLHSLEGPVTAGVRGSGAMSGLELVASFGTRLRSRHQRVVLDLDARLRPVEDWTDGVPRRMSLTADLVLRDVLLRLPPLEGGVPAVMPDARIRPELERPETARGEGPLDYSVRVHTAPGETLAIAVPVAEEPVPIAADIEAESGGPTRGHIAIGAVSVEATGIERDIAGGEIFLQLSEVQETARGELAVDDEDRRIDMTLAEMSGLFSPLPEPKPPLALGQIVTALLIGRAVDVAVVSRPTPTGEPSGPGDAPTSLEFQYRY